MRFHKALAMLLLLAAGPSLAGEAGDAVFAERGPWSLGDQALIWQQTVTGPQTQGFLPVTGGTVTLTEAVDPSDGKPVLELRQEAAETSRKIGPFPSQGGDPVLTFFLERTARDISALTGGSPFYIRNRMKDALFHGGGLTPQGDMVEARFLPFKGDPNAPRMGGFDTLELRFVMGDPGAPIREFQARTAGKVPGYLHHLVLQ